MTEQINTWQRFAEILIKTNELDPMYSVFRGLNQTRSREWMGRFLIYFICFYDAGGAAVAAETWQDNFWGKLKAAGQDKAVKRGTERRHFRGVNALRACNNLEKFGYTPWQLVEHMYPAGLGAYKTTYTQLVQRMTTIFAGTAMGPYFIWKLYDIFNICLDMPISLSYEEAKKYMPDEPRKAAEHFFPSFANGLAQVWSYIKDFDHPVLPGAKCDLAEAETILCAMKGFFKTGAYKLGDDIHERHLQLADHPELLKLLPWPVGFSEYKVGTLV